jgi:hypothetical protein
VLAGKISGNCLFYRFLFFYPARRRLFREMMMPWPGGFFNIPVDTPGWISGDCHPQPLIPIGRFYLSGHGSFHPQLTMILSEGWHDEVNADMYRFVSRDKRE